MEEEIEIKILEIIRNGHQPEIIVMAWDFWYKFVSELSFNTYVSYADITGKFWYKGIEVKRSHYCTRLEVY